MSDAHVLKLVVLYPVCVCVSLYICVTKGIIGTIIGTVIYFLINHFNPVYGFI